MWFGSEDHDEPVTFTDAEWDYMLDDPAFGYVCAAGHSQARWNNNPMWDGTCWTCDHENEAAYYEYEAHEQAEMEEGLSREIEDVEAREAEDRLLARLTYLV